MFANFLFLGNMSKLLLYRMIGLLRNGPSLEVAGW
jgi:hypothetical protein